MTMEVAWKDSLKSDLAKMSPDKRKAWIEKFQGLSKESRQEFVNRYKIKLTGHLLPPERFSLGGKKQGYVTFPTTTEKSSTQTVTPGLDERLLRLIEEGRSRARVREIGQKLEPYLMKAEMSARQPLIRGLVNTLGQMATAGMVPELMHRPREISPVYPNVERVTSPGLYEKTAQGVGGVIQFGLGIGAAEKLLAAKFGRAAAPLA